MKYILVLSAIILSLCVSAFSQTQSDAALRRITELDRTARAADGKLPLLTASEHLLRADVYSTNRLFPQAREHWAIYLANFPTDAGMPKALFGMARSYMWERQYEKAVEWFDKLIKDYVMTKDGREGLAFKGASLVRLGKNVEAAKTYEQYTVMFPNGERIETSHLNIIDAYREAKKFDEANAWVDKTRQKFAGKPTEVNAVHARLRMEIHREKWNEAIAAADQLLSLRAFAGSMVSVDEAKYLKAFALEKANHKADAILVYRSIAPSFNSYYSGLATEKIARLNNGNVIPTSMSAANLAKDYPVLYRAELLRSAKSRGIDPRFVLAIMKQESSFRANAKSPAAARGLLQLVYDTALKYNKKAGYPNLQPDDLYQPAVNIAVGSEYIEELKEEFGGLYEAIAASYNGGEDNAARWLARSKPKEAGIFSSEVGFAESKNYVFKVMNNYRIYRELYTEDLVRR
ncbi:MAG TPA: transglycosylase SLT domain-containing protein [Pyrinomonadaceae bacterium]|nr:transglycosylase SLT domain-containing protein [Pyrinomonadaceae bacterium]